MYKTQGPIHTQINPTCALLFFFHPRPFFNPHRLSFSAAALASLPSPCVIALCSNAWAWTNITTHKHERSQHNVEKLEFVYPNASPKQGFTALLERRVRWKRKSNVGIDNICLTRACLYMCRMMNCREKQYYTNKRPAIQNTRVNRHRCQSIACFLRDSYWRAVKIQNVRKKRETRELSSVQRSIRSAPCSRDKSDIQPPDFCSR